MKKNLRHKLFVCFALLLWLFASSSGMHGHFCFDGMEPPISVHFDLTGELQDDHTTFVHKDIDAKPAQLDVLKVPKVDLALFVAVFLLLIIWPIVRGQKYCLSNTPSSWLSIAGLRPPLRAPPVFSC